MHQHPNSHVTHVVVAIYPMGRGELVEYCRGKREAYDVAVKARVDGASWVAVTKISQVFEAEREPRFDVMSPIPFGIPVEMNGASISDLPDEVIDRAVDMSEAALGRSFVPDESELRDLRTECRVIPPISIE